MHIRLRERIQRNAERAGAGPQQAPRGLRRFLHHVAELAGERDLALARHPDRFDEHDVTADRRPRQSGGDADFGRAARDLALHFGLPGVLLEILGGDLDAGRLPLDHLERGLAEDTLDLALHLPHASLSRVLTDQPLQGPVGDVGTLGFAPKPRLLHLAREQIALGDLQFLGRRVAVERQLLHAIEQRIGNRHDAVRGRDEHHGREIERHLEIVIDEGRILRRIEHFEQRGGGIAAHVGAHLVHLVEHQHGTARLAALQRVENAAGDRAHIGATVTTNLRLVAHAAQRDAGELAPQRFGDALAERCLADAGRSHEAENRASRRRIQGAHREVLENALFHRFQIIVIAVQDFAPGLEVEPVLRHPRPRQCGEHIEIGSRDLILGGLGRHLTQPLQFAVADLLPFRRQLRFLEPLRELLQLVVALPLPQLLADDLELLAQHVLALILIQPVLYLLLDLRAHFQHLELLHQELPQALEPLRDVVDREQLGFGGQREIEIGGDEVGELSRLVNAGEHFVQLGAEVGRDVDDARELRDDGALQRFGARVLERVFLQRFGFRHQPLFALRNVLEARALQPLHHHAHRAVVELQHPHNRAEGADVVQLMRERVHHGALGRLHPPHRLHHSDQRQHDGAELVDGKIPGKRLVAHDREAHDVAGVDQIRRGLCREWSRDAQEDGKPEELGGCLASRISRKPCS